ncbi:MAG: hypothetical protein V4819_09995 [Verrucomicrobiota bacterium]
MRSLWLLLPLALAVVSCGTPSGSSEDFIVNRDTIDANLSTPRPPPSLREKFRSALLPTDTERAFELERKADLVAWYTTDGRIRIDAISGSETELVGSPAELSGFFDRHQKKSLVVIVVAKNVWDDAELASHLAFLNHYFTSHGYRRIVIQQARASGRPTHSDISPGSLLGKHHRAGRW